MKYNEKLDFGLRTVILLFLKAQNAGTHVISRLNIVQSLSNLTKQLCQDLSHQYPMALAVFRAMSSSNKSLDLVKIDGIT